ncbi:hypothetical protein [Aquipuribacter sp. SD81]|uniref:hypothetical protein n=1 Tax=Aquipuribacter sp. SD81 TaxID=3127703 RepID=UPI00301A6CC8
MADVKPSQGDADLLDLALELVERHAAGAADVRRSQVTDDLWEVRVTPRCRSAAEVTLVLVGDDEVAGAVGGAGFYCGWGDAEAVAYPPSDRGVTTPLG